MTLVSGGKLCVYNVMPGAIAKYLYRDIPRTLDKSE